MQVHRVSKFQLLMYIFYLTVICIPISNHINQTRHVQQHYETLLVANILIIFLTFYDLQYMNFYNVCCLRTIYAKYSNSTTNKITFIILIKYTSKV